LVLLGLLWLATAPTLAGPVSARARQGAAQGELPDGAGKQILQSACTACHDLDEVTKFKGFYTRAQWRDVVVTMVDYGAKLQPAEIDVLADYLDQHFGKR
jgi:virginiamycin B lyase